MAVPKKRKKKKEKRQISAGVAHIQSTFNNTIVTITDLQGNALYWSSGGSIGFKGTKKGTPYAAQMAAETAVRKAMELGMREVSIYVKGPGPGREPAIRAIQATGMAIKSIKDVTPLPHNGCRPRKKRRV